MVYEVHASRNYNELTQIICHKMAEGWECQGGISMDETQYYQAMIHRTLDKVTFLEELKEKMRPVKF